MKISKIITLIFIFVAFAFLHVFLQTETIKLGYEVKKNEDKLQEFIDDNNILKYNICALESPRILDKRVLLKDSSLKALKPFQVLSLYPESNTRHMETGNNEDSLAGNRILLGLKKLFAGRQAEAKTIK